MGTRDFMIGFKNLQKSHDLIGNGEKIISHAKTFKESASTCLKAATANPNDPDTLKPLVGIGDKEIKKLLSMMNAIEQQAEAMARAKLPEVASGTLSTWTKWFKAIAKSGEESKEAQRERKAYIKALKAYDSALAERIGYCQSVINIADRHIKTYSKVEAATQAGVNIAKKLMSLPELADMPYHPAALSIVLKYRSLPSAAKRVVKAHQALKPIVSLHQKQIEKLRKENAKWLADLARADLSKMLKDALKSAGVKL